MSLLFGPDTKSIKMKSVIASKAGNYIYLDGKGEVSMLLGLDITLKRKESVLANRARHFVY